MPRTGFYWTFGQATRVMAEIDNIVTKIAPDDNGVAIFRFESGTNRHVIQRLDDCRGGEHDRDLRRGGARSSRTTATVRRRWRRVRRARPPLRMIRDGESEWEEFHLPIPASQGGADSRACRGRSSTTCAG